MASDADRAADLQADFSIPEKKRRRLHPWSQVFWDLQGIKMW